MNKTILFIGAFLLVSQSLTAQFFSQSDVWPEGGDMRYTRYHVYGLAVATDGTILAFSEGRLKPGDADPHDIILKRSKDMGRTWSATQILLKSKHGTCYANPTPVVDKKTGNIILFYANNHNNEYSDVYCMVSKDNGITWRNRKKVTSLFDSDSLKRPFHLPGPGHGLTLSNGVLMMQIWHRYSIKLPLEERRAGISVIYSKDHGKTWMAGGFVPTPISIGESRLVELPDGRVLIECRSNYRINGKIKRVIAYSRDYGVSWSQPTFNTIPPFTSVDAGLNILNKQNKNYLLYSRPLGPGRRNLAISISEDNGFSWPYTRLVHQGSAGYSDVAVLPDQSILVLYGGWSPVSVTAARFDLAWIKQ